MFAFNKLLLKTERYTKETTCLNMFSKRNTNLYNILKFKTIQ